MSTRPRVLIAGPAAPPAGGIASVIDMIFAGARYDRLGLLRSATTPAPTPDLARLLESFDGLYTRWSAMVGIRMRRAIARLFFVGIRHATVSSPHDVLAYISKVMHGAPLWTAYGLPGWKNLGEIAADPASDNVFARAA